MHHQYPPSQLKTPGRSQAQGIAWLRIPVASIVPGSFQEFLQSLEPWETSLFDTIELRHPPHGIVRYTTDR
jgi:hypothetical protein